MDEEGLAQHNTTEIDSHNDNLSITIIFTVNQTKNKKRINHKCQHSLYNILP